MLLWALDGRLDATTAAELVASADEAVLVSAASIWEIEIKRAQGRLRLPDDFVDR